ncbi:DNA internalization-related competence protein ComEC/Rec2 [Salidesulfovibrio onnuriiensis]|uniref:DNA internalization-related competence protein ComEC/Rec2 n=1 Tax=Salidesulfovibrio onnuriiensis TaxID=2583823 RepID=UPI0011C9C826|nr:DNA internalization-related competence protein ComEC/Rec2 [Salidesulfovibrio onnuriiensis]
MSAGREQTRTPYNLPGLLPWQVYFFAFVLGIFSIRHPLASASVLAALWFADSRFRAWPLLINALIVFFFAGYGYALLRLPEPPPAMSAWMETRPLVSVEGTVKEVLSRPDATTRIILGDVRCTVPGGSVEHLPGRLLWTWKYPKLTPEPGQAVRAKLRLRPVRGFRNPGVWDYAWYWRLRGVSWQAWTMGGRVQAEWGEPPGGTGWRIRRAVGDTVVSAAPQTQGGAMLLALLAGDRFHLSPETMDLTRRAGLAHTLALSGLHVGFVALLGVALAYGLGFVFPSLLLRLPRPRLMVLLALPFVLGYAWLGQPSASLTRAALMYCSWGALLLLGRGRILLDGLLAAVAVIVLWNPLSAFDLSLQFSAVAVAGIALMFPLVRRVLPKGSTPGKRVCRWALGLLGVSLCANVALLPLMAWYFGTFTPNLLLNVLWLPLLGLVVMPLGVAGLLLALVPWTSSAGFVLLKTSGQVLDFMLSMLHWVAAHGWTPLFTVLRPLWLEVLGFTILLLCVLVALSSRPRRVGALAAFGLALLVLPHWLVMGLDAQDEVRVSVLDVGQGQSVLVTAPGGRRYLVDGGGTNSRTFDIGRAVVGAALTYGRPPRVEAVFMSHADIDHSQGLVHILDAFDCDVFYTNGDLPEGRVGRAMRSALEGSGLAPRTLVRGDVLEAGDIVFQVLHPARNFDASDSNENSLVLRVIRRGHGLALIPGDIGQQGVHDLLALESGLRAEMLVLPHHGSETGCSREFYEQVGPKVAVASCGFLNRYGFPADEVRSVLRRWGVLLLDTATGGMVTARWKDGSQSLEMFDNNKETINGLLLGDLLF